MNPKKKLLVLIGAGVLVISAIAGCVTQTSNGGTTSIGTAPPEVLQYAADWPLPNKNYENTRSTNDSSINSGNVKTLGVAWAVPLQGASPFGAAACTPIVIGNKVFIQDLTMNTYSIDRTTGKINWVHYYNEEDVGPNGCAVGYGKVFIPRDPFNVAALDINTGNELWSQSISTKDSIGIDIQPTVFDNTVFASSVPGSSLELFYQGGAYGTFYGLNQSKGTIIWKWDTIDDPAKMWGMPTIASGGGTWFPPAINTKTGRTFWGVANPAPTFGGTLSYPNGEGHPGPNLYTDSAVCLDYKTGKLLWFHQVWPHDNNDYDLQQSPVLAKATIDGKLQDIAIFSGKMGRVYAFNQTTGNMLWQCAVGIHQNDLLIDRNATPIEVFPGFGGGVETPIAYSEGVVFAAPVNAPNTVNETGFSVNSNYSGTGDITAIDVNYGRYIWTKELPSPCYGGATVSNDVVFTSTYDGTIYAFNTKNGDLLWTYKTPGGIIAWPAIVGDMFIIPCGVGSAPELVAFKLGASSPYMNIARPVENSTVHAGNVSISVGVFNFNIVDKQGQTAAPGEGHLHYYLDYDAPTTQGKPAVPPNGTIWQTTAATTYTFHNVSAGPHFVTVEVVNNDHTPLNPPVVFKVRFTTKANAPSVHIASPKNHALVSAGPITVKVNVTNFNLGTDGKIIFYFDSAIPKTPGQVSTVSNSVTLTTNTYTWQMPEGTHTFGVQLVTNDLKPLPIIAYDTSVVTTYAGSSGFGP